MGLFSKRRSGSQEKQELQKSHGHQRTRSLSSLLSLLSLKSLASVHRRRISGHSSLGAWGERLAACYLERSGFRLVMTNFTAPTGKRRDGRLVTGEIDIIAYDESGPLPVLVFVEVKTRSRVDLAAPEAAVDRRKQRQIVRAAQVYRRLLRVWDEPRRYDVITIVARPGESPEMVHRRGYFSEEALSRARGWSERG